MIAARHISNVHLPSLPKTPASAAKTFTPRLESISIVVPVLNEAELIAPFLLHLRERAPGAELIVADGGSSDGTRELARNLCDQIVCGTNGRAQQLNEGARAARGELLWFLHVDSEVPQGCLNEIRAALASPKVVGGYFRIRLPHEHFVYRLTDSFAHYAGLVLRLRCGDHGFFCRRDSFFQAGQFPDVPLMEDVEFYRKLRRVGRVVALRERMKTSARRYEKLGRLRVTLAYGLIASLYVLRVPLRVLAAIYSFTCQTKTRSPAEH